MDNAYLLHRFDGTDIEMECDSRNGPCDHVPKEKQMSTVKEAKTSSGGQVQIRTTKKKVENHTHI